MKLSVKDALTLEAHEVAVGRLTSMRIVANSSSVTESFISKGRMIEEVRNGQVFRYPRLARTQPRPFTKKRRKLPGKRVWGGAKRTAVDRALGRAITNEFNARQKAIAVQRKLFKSRPEKQLLPE